MKLKTIFDQLTYGEFSQLSIGGQEPGVIKECNWERVLSHVTLGLTALHKRFFLKEGRLVVALQAGKESYRLHSDFSIHSTAVAEASRYLQDSADERFADDILKIERVLTDGDATEDEKQELALNDKNDRYSLSTPSSLVLRVPPEMVTDGAELPEHLVSETLEVVYRADHAKILWPITNWDPASQEVDLPVTHLEALLYFVASRAHNPVGMSNEFHMGNSYFAKYENECLLLENSNLTVDQNSQNDRLRANGWV
jgi:hypothetical protein